LPTPHPPLPLARQPIWRLALAASCAALLLSILAANTAQAFNAYQDAWVTLSARPLGMGGAFTALSDPASVFYNPAGLAGQRCWTLLFNHNARHFPGVEDDARQLHRVDQLDCDTEAIAVPLPGATYAHGFTFSGEYGYDYRGLTEHTQQGYPRENVWGNEDYHALALGGGLPWSAGYSLRRQFLRLTPEPGDHDTPAWLRLGQGEQWGVLARLAPGLDYGHSELRFDYDWTLLEPSIRAGEGFAEMSSRLKTQRSGWALHPTAWLTLATDGVHEDHRYVPKQKKGAPAVDPATLAGYGSIHTGDQSIDRVHTGGELQLGQLARLRWGNYDGAPTCGVALNLGGLWLNYAEAQGLLPKLMGRGDAYKDVHVYGAELRF
jgi:hypothetical protein